MLLLKDTSSYGDSYRQLVKRSKGGGVKVRFWYRNERGV